MSTSDIIDIILKNANVESGNISEPYCSIKKQLRYYREDIPDRPRYLFDADAVYFYNCDNSIADIRCKRKRRDLAERGDIMTSLWAPLTYYLKLNGSRIISKDDKNIDKILKQFNFDRRVRDIFQLMEYLSVNYVTRGNLFLLPNSVNSLNKRCLNLDKFKSSEDKIDQFLYACLEGKLKEYFENKTENVITWIVSEHLECMFSPSLFEYSLHDIENGKAKIDVGEECIKVENIQSLINNPSRISSYNYRELTDDEWKIYFERLNKIIAYRNFTNIESHLPLEW